MTRQQRYNQARNRWVARRAALCVACFACAALLAGLVASGCTNAKGQDVSRRTANADTRATEAVKTDRQTDTRSVGGITQATNDTTEVRVTPQTVEVRTTGVTATSKPASTAQVVIERADRRATTQTTTRSDDASTLGATFSGPFQGMLSVDGLVVKSVESTFKRRWPIFAGLLLAGLYFTFAPLTLGGNRLGGIGFFGGAAAALILSDGWLIVICTVAVTAALWKNINRVRLLGRYTEVLDDWKNGMSPEERAALNGSLERAAGKQAKLADDIRVEQKHNSNPPVVAVNYVDPPAVVL